MWHTRNIVLVSLCWIAAVLSQEKSYSGYELIEVLTTSQRDREAIIFLEQLDPEVDFWRKGPESVHVFVAPEKLDDLKSYLQRNELQYSVLNDQIQRDIESERVTIEAAKQASPKAFDVNNFNTYEDISAELINLATRCRSDLGVNCEVYSIGQTYEGRDLFVLRIWKNAAGRKAVWLDATIHAREWLGTATHLKITTNLVDNYPSDPQVQYLVDTYDWYLLPVVNPDGYSYTWSNDRMWRKNRTPNLGSPCLGTDLNRNFKEGWSNAGSSALPCSETYQGDSAASELETQAVQTEAVRVGSTLLTSIHLHTYSKLWLIPWGSYSADGVTCKIADDDAEMMVVANAAADAVENTYNTVWARGNSCVTIYPASGLTMDYFKAFAGVKYTATPELRGNSFIVAASEIQPSFEEVWNGLTTAISTIESQP
jgi:carboxypeptidase A2